jgi:threonine synthase
MNRFFSTGDSVRVSLREAVFSGLAPDGGLYVPGDIPSLPECHDDVCAGGGGSDTDSFKRVARWAAPPFFPELSREIVADVVERAFTFPVPIVEVEPDHFVLELFHGPTHAFKDVGARFMAALMIELSEGQDPVRTVLVATSGDTGGAVADAFHRLPGYRVVVLFPQNGISERQRRQMTTLRGNVRALAVQGTFDDCQRVVKEAFLDPVLRAEHSLTSANSINVARLLPQSLYYVYAACAVQRRRGLGAHATPPRFVVPSGNLGNLCAGLLACRAGMRSSGFVAATNTNRAFVDVLDGEAYRPRPSIPSLSNAMDVGAPSNFERILWLYDGDLGALRRDVLGVSVCDEEATRCIADIYRDTGYVLDPHTAVAYEAARRQPRDGDAPLVVLATAHPAKFPDVVEPAIGATIPTPPGLMQTYERTEFMREVPPTLAALSRELELQSA